MDGASCNRGVGVVRLRQRPASGRGCPCGVPGPFDAPGGL